MIKASCVPDCFRNHYDAIFINIHKALSDENIDSGRLMLCIGGTWENG